MRNIVRHIELPCPNCKEKLDATSAIGHEVSIPKDGNITVCAYCGEEKENCCSSKSYQKAGGRLYEREPAGLRENENDISVR
jgi:hypothetical protein